MFAVADLGIVLPFLAVEPGHQPGDKVDIMHYCNDATSLFITVTSVFLGYSACYSRTFWELGNIEGKKILPKLMATTSLPYALVGWESF